jgi:hypothetical protein
VDAHAVLDRCAQGTRVEAHAVSPRVTADEAVASSTPKVLAPGATRGVDRPRVRTWQGPAGRSRRARVDRRGIAPRMAMIDPAVFNRAHSTRDERGLRSMG